MSKLNTSHLVLKLVPVNGKMAHRWVDPNTGTEHAPFGSKIKFQHHGKEHVGTVGSVVKSGEYAVKGDNGKFYNKHKHQFDVVKEMKNFTPANVINEGYEKIKAVDGERKAKKYFEEVDKLINPNQNEVYQYRTAGVVVKEGDKYIFNALADMHMKNWRIAHKTDITDQIKEKQESKKYDFKQFVDIVKSSKSPEEAYKKAQNIKGISPEESKAFAEKYDSKDILTPKQAFEKFYGENKPKEKKTWRDFLSYNESSKFTNAMKRAYENELRAQLADKIRKRDHSMTPRSDKQRLKEEVWDLEKILKAYDKANEHNAS